ncbi:hypothetical protein ASZ90_005606 [hydrocarbon metagenome]|uniref:Uncharacterized protein n=1 Tax=hydrocarbon metagenome TaxID=938273 RepID=A0A0W8FUH7_9ZZZZ
MTLDIFIPFLIGAVAGFIALYGIVRLKGVWILGALLYIAGATVAFLTVHVIFYFLVADTHYVYLPGVMGFVIWSVFCLRLFLQHIFWNGPNPTAIH